MNLNEESSPPLDVLGHRQRLRARLIVGGPGALADYEVLEVLLFAARPRGGYQATGKSADSTFRHAR